MKVERDQVSLTAGNFVLLAGVNQEVVLRADVNFNELKSLKGTNNLRYCCEEGKLLKIIFYRDDLIYSRC